MNTNPIPLGTIVVGVDGSTSAERALCWAIEQAVAEHRPLTLAHGIPPADALWHDQAGHDQRAGLRGLRSAGEKILDAARAEVTRRAPHLQIHEHCRVADPRVVLLDLAQDAAMVVLGSRGRGPLRSLLLGSVGVAVSRHATCPVIIHRPGKVGAAHHGVLVGISATEASMPVLEFGYRQASLRGLPLTVLHAYWVAGIAVAQPYFTSVPDVDLEGERLTLAECVSSFAEKYPDVRVTTELARGAAGDVLVHWSERMDLVVVGSHQGAVATDIVFGGVATSVVEHAHGPVAVVPVQASCGATETPDLGDR